MVKQLNSYRESATEASGKERKFSEKERFKNMDEKIENMIMEKKLITISTYNYLHHGTMKNKMKKNKVKSLSRGVSQQVLNTHVSNSM